MSFRRILNKPMDSLRRRDKGAHEKNEPSSSRPDSVTTPPVIALPPEQELIAADPLVGYAPLTGHGIAMNTESVHSVNTQAHSENGDYLLSQSTFYRGTQDATFREGIFANAHNFIIQNAHMNEGVQREEWRLAEEERRAQEERRAAEERRASEDERIERERKAAEERRVEEEKQAKEALKELAARGMPGAMLDSKDRGYVPRCNEDTRQALRGRIIGWVQNDVDSRRLLWLSGPAAVGKSAVAQTVAEALKTLGLLGGVFFFSRPNNRSDPDVVIPTLAYQLSIFLPEYQRILSRQLVNDPLILNKNRRSQFQDLIIDPCLSLMTKSQAMVQRSLLIVLDGLDECHDRAAQCEFVEMISYYIQKERDLRLRWMICSRPEPDLRVAFSSVDCKAICLQEKLEVDDSEAQKDARRILETGFAEIRQRYPDHLSHDWPTEDQVSFIADRASGLLGFAPFIVRFIGDRDYDDPSGQLDVCLRFLQCTSGSENLNPLHALDLLYTQILSDIPATTLPTTQRILGLFIFYDNKPLTAAAHGNFLGLNQAFFYRSLQRLHSVLLVPSASEAGHSCIRIYHASFSDYLKDPARSGRFVLEEGVVPYLDVALTSLKWLRYGRENPSERSMPELTWNPPNATRKNVLSSLCMFSFSACWMACPRVPKDSLATLIEALENFDFNNFDYGFWSNQQTGGFAHFILWLTSLDTGKTPLAIIDHWNTKFHDPAGKREITIWYRDSDPYSFVMPFLEDASCEKHYTIYVRLGRPHPIPVWLFVGRGGSDAFICPQSYMRVVLGSV